MYATKKLAGIDGELGAHMCLPSDVGMDMVELWVNGGPVILSREQFRQFTHWVEEQFAILEKQTRTVH
jgi:hypothetical protein